ncbi:glycosyltransferase, partial [Blautia sp.]
MNEKILISYIIPAYNAADTLERAVESITHTCNMEKCEILIVENGSTDYTNSVA